MSDGDSRHRSDGKLRATLQRGHLWLIGALISSVVLLAVAGTDVRQLLRYERAAVLGGEWWRLLTGHLVHGGLRHLSLNMAGIGLVALLCGRDYSPGHWLLILLASTLAIDLGFVFYQPQLEWYVGLSGVLHGCIAAGLIAWWRYENRVLTLAVAVLQRQTLLGTIPWRAAAFRRHAGRGSGPFIWGYRGGARCCVDSDTATTLASALNVAIIARLLTPAPFDVHDASAVAAAWRGRRFRELG